MISKNRVGGLCASCVKASDCGYTRSRRRYVYQCDEFEAGVSIEAILRDSDPPETAESDVGAAAVAATNGRLGLCRSCDNWEMCAFRPSEGGVWHCDEYR